ncbi:YitT family protein [Lutibacter sp. B1]|uniref:YitT family protein n=1 Tax=Lutibacter sp. B1 TaxID=2725996 RepID=UPI001456557F|nr:YitT family protein [Lutibacter sp. B1]NLP58431.1 YitT family protein [Lutibacter sp. B1]
MNPIFHYIIVQALKRKSKNEDYKITPSKFKKEVKNVRVELNHLVHDSFLILLGVLSATLGLRGFLIPNSFIDGGVTGISLIIAEITGVSLSLLLIAVNIPFMILAFYTIGRRFAAKSIIAILLLALFVHFIPFPAITHDKLLIAVFGGFFLGLGIGLAIRGGSVIDGTEVLAVFVSKKTSVTIGDVILIFNILIFGVAVYTFTIEISLYAMLTYLAASKTVDFVVSGIEEYVGVTIISDKNEEIRNSIINNVKRGCTVYTGKRGKTLNNVDIVYTVLTRLELAKLHTEIDKIDRNAFIVMENVKDVKGGVIKKRPLK